MQVYGNKDEMIHANDINRLSKQQDNRRDTLDRCTRIIGDDHMNNNNKFAILYYYDSDQKLLSVLYVNHPTNSIVLYYKDNEDVDDDEIDGIIDVALEAWFDLMELLYGSHSQMIPFIAYDEDSKTNYMKNKIKLQLPDVFIDEDYVAKAISHEVFEERIEDIRLRL